METDREIVSKQGRGWSKEDLKGCKRLKKTEEKGGNIYLDAAIAPVSHLPTHSHLQL